MGGRGCAGWSGVKWGKWDNCNSIINKIYLKKDKQIILKAARENQLVTHREIPLRLSTDFSKETAD